MKARKIRIAERRKHLVYKRLEQGKKNVKGRKCIKINLKVLWREKQGFVAVIGHYESIRLYEKFESSTNILRLAKWFNDNFPKLNEIKVI